MISTTGSALVHSDCPANNTRRNDFDLAHACPFVCKTKAVVNHPLYVYDG